MLPTGATVVFADVDHRRGLCPHAEAYYEEELSLPMFPALSDADVDRVCETLVEVLR